MKRDILKVVVKINRNIVVSFSPQQNPLKNNFVLYVH